MSSTASEPRAPRPLEWLTVLGRALQAFGVFWALLTLWGVAAGIDAAPAQAPARAVSPASMAAARRIVQQAARDAAAIQDQRQRSVYVELARHQARVDDVQGALQSLAAAPTPHDQRRLFALQEIAAAQARAGDMSAALQTIATLPAGFPRYQAMTVVARAQALAGDVPAALKTAASATEPSQRDAIALQIARALFDIGDIPGTLRVVSSITQATHRSDVVAFMARVDRSRADPVAVLPGAEPPGRRRGVDEDHTSADRRSTRHVRRAEVRAAGFLEESMAGEVISPGRAEQSPRRTALTN